MKSVVFFGDVARDKVDNGFVAGGGVYYGSIAFTNCDTQKQYKVNVFTKLADEDKKLYFEFDEAKINPIYLKSPHTTQCEHSYPTSNPDDRLTLAVQLCEPFTEEQVKLIPKADAILLNTLYKGCLAQELLPAVKELTPLLVVDAQGFVRCVENNIFVRHDWKDKEEWLKYIDLLKIDSLEGELLTGEKDLKQACKILIEKGAHQIIATHKDGVYIFDEKYSKTEPAGEALWGKWTLEGRTGRGDTVTAAYVYALLQKMPIREAVKYAAEICTRKMQKAGPFKG